MAVLKLGYEDVRQCLTMTDAIEAIEDMCREQASGSALFAERINLKLPNGWIRLMPGALTSSGVLGYKEFHLNAVADSQPPAAQVRYAFHLFDYMTGEPLAVMDANLMTSIRTGAASGVAMKYLTRPKSSVLGVIGSGSEARSHVRAAAIVRKIRKVVAFSRSAERRDKFARDMENQMGIEVVSTGDIQEPIDQADILLVATNTAGAGPALFGEALRSRAHQGLHINSIGSTLPTQRELDPAVWSFADRIVLDSRRLLDEGGDGIAAKNAGVVSDAKVAELFEVVAGGKPGRTSQTETTLYKSIGTGLQDVAVAVCIYRNALAKGIGSAMEPCQSVKMVEPN